MKKKKLLNLKDKLIMRIRMEKGGVDVGPLIFILFQNID